MKRWMSIILGAMMAVMCMMSMAMPAYAAENPRISIPVTVSLSGTLPQSAENFTIKLKANNTSYPMPGSTVGDVYTMTITGADRKDFPSITYNQVGVYTYTIYQVAGSNKECTYDDTVYSLTVYITNMKDGNGLEATAVLYPKSEGEKLSGAEFKNEYETVKPTISDSPKTGDESNPVLYVVLIVVSLGVIATLLRTYKTRKTEE